MTELGEALGLRMESDYTPPPPAPSRQPWPSGAVRLATVAGALLVGFLLAAGLTAGREAARAQTARKAQLIALVDARQDRAAALSAQLEELRGKVTRAENAAAAGAPALNARLAKVEAATGLTALRGPGVRVTFGDAETACPTGREEDCRIQDVDLQLAVNTLWGLGAEGVAINGERVIATTAIRSAGTSILVNYRVLTPPYVVEAVGDPQALTARFGNTQIARDFAVWRDVYGLGFSVDAVDPLVLPAYAGSVRVDTATDVGRKTRRGRR